MQSNDSFNNDDQVDRTKAETFDHRNQSSRNGLDIPNDVHFVTGRSSEGGAARSSGTSHSSKQQRAARKHHNRHHASANARGLSDGHGSGTISSGHSSSSDSRNDCNNAGSSSLSETDQDEAEAKSGDDISSKNRGSVKKKRDRSTLRKGKWSVEEEEYTSRIIHYFRIGLLTLPDGATLRSYLANKLNCDPMRITKKYAGASCLGRRVYHHRDRISHQPPTVSQIHIAKVELDLLETRFRLRVEGGEGNNETHNSLLSLPTGPDAIAQTIGMIAQQQQQQQLQQQQTAVANAAYATAQQSIVQNAANPLQALLLSLAAAAGSTQPERNTSFPSLQPPMNVNNGPSNTNPSFYPSNQTREGHLSHLTTNMQNGSGWAAPAPSVQGTHGVGTGTSTATSMMSNFPTSFMGLNSSSPPMPVPSNKDAGNSWQPGTMNPVNTNTISQSQDTASSQQNGGVDPNVTLALLAKALGPTMAQAVIVAASLKKAVEQSQGLQQQTQVPATNTSTAGLTQHAQVMQQRQELAANFQRAEIHQHHLHSNAVKQQSEDQMVTASQHPNLSGSFAQGVQNLIQQQQQQQQQVAALPESSGSGTLQSVLNQLQNFQSQLLQQSNNQQQQSQPPQQCTSQQQQQQSQLPPLLPGYHQQPSQVDANAGQQSNDFVVRLKEVYDQHIQMQQRQLQQQSNDLSIRSSPLEPEQPGNTRSSSVRDVGNVVDQVASTSQLPTMESTSTQILETVHSYPAALGASSSITVNRPGSLLTPAMEQDVRSDGNVLCGFLSSLKQSYEDALRGREGNTAPQYDGKKQKTGESNVTLLSNNGNNFDNSRLTNLASIVALAAQSQETNLDRSLKHQNTVPTVTDSASSTQNQVDSSVDDYSDWNTDKKSDPSSSEESDEAAVIDLIENQRRLPTGKGPPRKRMKASK